RRYPCRCSQRAPHTLKNVDPQAAMSRPRSNAPRRSNLLLPVRGTSPAHGPRAPRRSQRLRRGLGIAALTLSAFAGGAVTSRLSQASLDDHSPFAVIGQLSRVLVLIENEYVDPVDRDRLLSGAIKGMVAELDPHSSYLPPRDFRVLQDD